MSAFSGVGVPTQSQCSAKVAFAVSSLSQEPPSAFRDAQCDADVHAIIDWLAAHSPQQIREEREKQIAAIEKRAEALRTNGDVERWFSESDPLVRRVAAGFNGPLAMECAESTHWHDLGGIAQFRCGGLIAGRLQQTGLGPSKDSKASGSVSDLARSSQDASARAVSKAKADKHSAFLLQQACEDASVGRMSWPVKADGLALSDKVVAHRFCVEQGTKPDGAPKLRAIDDMSASGVNSCCIATEKIVYDGLDALVAAMICFQARLGFWPTLWKADVDSAFRRIPIAPSHHAMCFGLVGSVHAWNRIAAFIRHVARTLLRIPVFCFVDDYFSLESHATVEHAMWCFVRLVRALLGGDAIAPGSCTCGKQGCSACMPRKCSFGLPLCVLGIEVTVGDDGVEARPSPDKVAKWLAQLDGALSSGFLPPGEAAKLAGRLQFATQHMFRRLGRAMLRPLYQQQYAPLRGNRIGNTLRAAMSWWKAALERGWCQARAARGVHEERVEVFCDARSTPPRLAAVLVSQSGCWFTDMEPSPRLLSGLTVRRDAQIMGLELLAVVLGLSSFASQLSGKCVRVWEDNSAAESVMLRGSAASTDHNMIAHSVWLIAAKLRCCLWIERVASADNIADDPSREDYEAMKEIGARWVRPRMPSNMWRPTLEGFAEI